MTLIQDIHAREIIDARGLPALEADVTLNCGALGRASIPAGIPEELLDKDERFAGKGLRKAMEQVEERIGLVLRGMDALDQTGIDRELLAMNRIAGNARLVVSLAVAQAAAIALELPLSRYLGGVNAKRPPLPLVQLPHLNGEPTAFTNACLMPIAPDWTPAKALQASAEVTQLLLLDKDSPIPQNDMDRLDAIRDAIEKAGYSTEKDLALALETAPGHSEELAALVTEAPVQLLLCQEVSEPLAALNLPLAAQSAPAGQALQARITRPYACQTLTDFLDQAEKAQRTAAELILDASAPGTGDPLPPELAMAIRAQFIMAGPLTRFDAVTTYNQLLRLT